MNNLDIFPTFFSKNLAFEGSMTMTEYYEANFRSFIYILGLLFFCSCVEKSNVKAWLIFSCLGNSLIKFALLIGTGIKLQVDGDFFMILLIHMHDALRAIMFSCGVISIFHWNRRSTAMVKMVLFMTAEFSSLLLATGLSGELYSFID